MSVVYSPRLKKSVALCDVSTHTIRLNPRLKTKKRTLLLEVLCHEAAHIAIYETYGILKKPHGIEWGRFMRAAGYEPRVTSEAMDASTVTPPGMVGRAAYVHRCPVCQTARTARRPVTRWRCAPCSAAGLDGRLDITRVLRKGAHA